MRTGRALFSALSLGFLAAPSVTATPEITVFDNRASFESAIGPGRFTEDFSVLPLLFPVSSARGAVVNGKWRDVARDPEPSTVWEIPCGTTGWGGTWDLTVSGTGGGLAFELDFGGGHLMVVPAYLDPASPEDQFFGITASQPVYGVRVRQHDSEGGKLQETYAFDDLTVAVSASGEIAVHDGATTAAARLADGQLAPVDFGTVARDAVVRRSMTIANPGTDPLRVLALSTGGAFQIANAPPPPWEIAPGDSRPFDLIFSSGSGGVFDGRVDVLSSDDDATRFNFPVRAMIPIETEIRVTDTRDGTDVVDGQAAAVEIEPNPFGGGSSVSLAVANSGPDPLVVSGVSLPAGFDFAFNGSPALPRVIPGGESLVFTITSTGPAPGVYDGGVTVTSNDADEGEFTFPIRGLFDLPEIQVLRDAGLAVEAGSTVDFGATPLAGKKSISLVVRNLHSASLTVGGVTLPAAGYALGPLAPAFPFSLGRNETREIPVELTGEAIGTFDGTFSILNNDDDEGPFELQFTGAVLDPATWEPRLTRFIFTPATAVAGLRFAGEISGPPAATVVVEGSGDLGGHHAWEEVARVTLDAAGLGSIPVTPVPGTIGIRRFFARLRLLAP